VTSLSASPIAGMVFGPIPNVDEVVAAIAGLEQRLNRGHAFTLPISLPTASKNES
jgi:hypothetical protein